MNDWFKKLLDATDKTASMHTLVFMVFALAVIGLMTSWFVWNLLHSVQMNVWSDTLKATFITASGSHVINTALDGRVKGDTP